MNLFLFIFLAFYINATNSNILGNLHENIQHLFKRSNYENKPRNKTVETKYILPLNEHDDKDNALQKELSFEDNLSTERKSKPGVHLGVSNEDIERKTSKQEKLGFRRFYKDELNKNWLYVDSIGITSSSAEEKEWKKEYLYKWNAKKAEAIQDPIAIQKDGDIVNMAAARPWRTPCGDENQHDTPWGTCTLPQECPPEFRIYRGDHYCGRTSFVCCGLQNLEHDMYEAFDPTMSDTSQFSTTSDEGKTRSSKEKKKRNSQRIKNRQILGRHVRKRRMKKTIIKLAKIVRKKLNRAFRNNTRHRRYVTLQLKKLLHKMKQKFRFARMKAKTKHDLDIKDIDAKLKVKLQEIRSVNYNFLTNDTFRDIVINGSVPREGDNFDELYPELNFYPEPIAGNSRRFGGSMVGKKEHNKQADYPEYDNEEIDNFTIIYAKFL